jgi:glycosyltransferase involved in cell wall biosynthesis
MASSALVSVIIPAFRAERTIARTVASLVAQTWPRWEAIVVSDDGADYARVLADAGIADARVRHASTGRVGSGAATARNAGLAASSGDVVAPLDADDTYHPERLAVLAPLALGHGAAGSNVRVVDEETEAVIGTLFPPDEATIALDAEAFLATSVPMMMLVRRDLCPGWADDIRLGEDVLYNLQLIDRAGPVPVSLRLLQDYRVRHGSICHADDSAALAEQGYRIMLARLLNDGLGLSDPAIRARFAASLERKIALNRAYAQARAAEPDLTFQAFIARR